MNNVVAVENVALRLRKDVYLALFSHFTVDPNVLMTFNYIVKIRAKDAVILLFSKAINSID